MMVEGIEGVGEAITGGMIARAVEPGAGEASNKHGAACLNCGTALVGDYCHRCGQAGHIHRTLTAWWHDLVHGVLHLDGKVWRTLPLLAWRPGLLTRRYIEGERARFVSSIALFLFSVFLMFAVISAVGDSISASDLDPNARERLAAVVAEGYQAVEETDRQRAAAIASGTPTDEIDARRERQMKSIRFYEKAIEDMAERRTPSFTDLKTGWPPLDRGIDKANANPGLMLYKIQTNAYKFSWALIPISVPFLWLLFAWRRQYRLYDHAIFVTYSLSFMTLFVVALTLAGMAGVGSATIALTALLIPPIHMYRQLRGAYRLRRVNAFVRMIVLLTFASIAISAFVLLLLAMGLLG